MLKIILNKELFDLHIEEISKSITKLISKKLKSKLCLYEKECLVYVKDNLKSILQADNNQMKKYIEHFKNHFPKAIGDFNTEEKKGRDYIKFYEKIFLKKSTIIGLLELSTEHILL